MRRVGAKAGLGVALLSGVAQSSAFSDPYFEYQVAVSGFPVEYFTDLQEAALTVIQRECERFDHTNCIFQRTSYFNSLFLAHYRGTHSDGNTYNYTAWGYHYFTCDISPSLYIKENGVTRGPYENRRIAPPVFGTPFCGGKTPETETEHQSDLGAGDCETRPNAGNPINVGLNNKYQEVIDIEPAGGSPLHWSRYYNSGVVGTDNKLTAPATVRLGSRWRGTYDRSLAPVTTKEGNRIRLQRHTGERLDFVESDGRYRSVADPRGQLSRDGEGWLYRTGNGSTEAYDAKGRLVAMDAGTGRHVELRYDNDGALFEIVDRQGRKLTFAHDSAGRVAAISDGNGVAVSYSYSDASEAGLKADLVRATYADSSFHEYRYNEQGHSGGAGPHALTAIYDETGERFATFSYDTEGRAVASEHVGGVGAVQLAREADGTVAVTGPNKAIHRYRYAEVRGVRRLVGVDQPGGAGCGAANATIEYDDNGMVKRRVDFDGRATGHVHDADGNELERTEAAGTPAARRIMTEWHPVLRRPTKVTSPGREERYSYDAAGNVVDVETWGAIDPDIVGAPLILSRVWRMTYDSDGRLTHEEGPRSDADKLATLARYTYRNADAANCASGACDYRKGDLWKIENALGHTEEILTYDGAGRIRSRKDEHGSTFNFRYTARGWLTEVEETRPDGVVVTTALTYNPRGDIASITDADGVTIRFDYDKAGRLVEVSNHSGHRLRFQLDAAGQRTKEEAYDSFALKTQLTRTFDALGRVETETREGAVTRFTYDELGRPTGMTDADGRQGTSSYDALGRLREAVRDIGGIRAISKATYDPLDQLKAIEDPNGLSTRYLTTGLGDVGSVESPDAGGSLDEHDTAGLLIRHVGAGGVGSFRVTRDALGRPIRMQYDGGIEATYSYDTVDPMCPANQRYALGRLSSMEQGESRTVYCYDAPGNVTQKIQYWGTTTIAVSYRFSKAGRLEEVAPHGGARATYRHDSDGNTAAVAVEPPGAAKTDLISKVTYAPFDLIESWRYGNGQEIRAGRDKSGRVTSWGGIDRDNSLYALSYTPGGEVATQAARAYAFRLEHDGLGYLTATKHYSTGSDLQRFEYDATGDRTALTVDGVRQTYLYEPASHRLTAAHGKSRRYDAAGNTIGMGNASLDYDAAGRLASASEQSRTLVSYGYDAAGQRIARTETGKAADLWLYDEQGHWLADYDASGTVIRQAVWMGDYLVGLVEGTKLYYVEPDHLGTSRAIVDPTRNATVWRWRPNEDPFGTALPEEDPDGDGARFVFDLRFPGQRYDAATGLHYNYYRDYDPETGRYIQVDPIGLAGGINPYLYVGASPLKHVDPLGLVRWSGTVRSRSAALGVGFVLYDFDLESECIEGERARVHVRAPAASIGLNIKYAPPIFSLSESSVTLNDRMDRVEPAVLNGWFSIWSAGIAAGAGYGGSMIQIGGVGRVLARPRDSGAFGLPSFGPETGLELGAGGAVGKSRVTQTNWTSCGCSR